MRILLIANGDKVELNFLEFDKIICVDGGLNHIPNDITPSAIIGDFDSAESEKINSYHNASKIIIKNNQDESDLNFAIRYCLTLQPTEIVILNAISCQRMDHSLCNIILLEKIPNNIVAKIITSTQEICLIRSKYEIKNHVNKTLSLIPLTNCANVKTNGLKWEINYDLQYGFINGISNIITKQTATVSVKSGSLLCIVER